MCVHGNLKNCLPRWSELSCKVVQKQSAAFIWPSSFLGICTLKCSPDIFDGDDNSV